MRTVVRSWRMLTLERSTELYNACMTIIQALLPLPPEDCEGRTEGSITTEMVSFSLIGQILINIIRGIYFCLFVL